LLNEAKEYFSRSQKSKDYSGICLIAFYFLGVIGYTIINKLIHHFAFKDSSIHHHHYHHHHHHNIPNDIKKSHMNNEESHNLLNHNGSHDERSPLLINHMDRMSSPLYVESNSRCNEATCSDRHSVCMVENDTEEPLLESLYCENSHDHHANIHQNDQESEQLMRIGIQTALAISIHKFPGIFFFFNLVIIYLRALRL